MASTLELVRKRGSMHERLIVALDVDDLEQAKELVRVLAGEVGMFKVGKQLFTHAGPQAVRLIQELGGEIFLDLKFHDIPSTVAKAAIEATRFGVKMFNVHASGSLEMMRTTVKEVRRVCRQEQRRRPIMLAVTVLTSLNQDDLTRVGVEAKVADQVVRLALLTKQAGMDGVVASPHEVADIREACGRRFVIVTPGIRSTAANRNDQLRVMTPAEAVRAGVDYIVVGRPILEAKDPVGAARAIVAESKFVQAPRIVHRESNFPSRQGHQSSYRSRCDKPLLFPKTMKVMHGAVTGADRETFSDCLGDVFLGEGDGSFDRFAFRQMGGNRRRKGTAGPVRVLSANARRDQRRKCFSVVKQVDSGAFAMTALNHDAFRPQLNNSPGGLCDVLGRA